MGSGRRPTPEMRRPRPNILVTSRHLRLAQATQTSLRGAIISVGPSLAGSAGPVVVANVRDDPAAEDNETGRCNNPRTNDDEPLTVRVCEKMI
jgi:hypothetical protein